ncbi:hypothetical protein ACQEU5_00965 [Marinactinospora thermotolerans]|uniref:hypothetical protein n=1 Tax=Marinactinospora thermotolerans TaxID=531310 RepID=UPI003D9471DD
MTLTPPPECHLLYPAAMERGDEAMRGTGPMGVRKVFFLSAVLVMLVGCSLEDVIEPRWEVPNPTVPPPEASLEGFAEFSDLSLPEGMREVSVDSGFDDYGRVVYWISFVIDDHGAAESVCEQEGSLLSYADGLAEYEREQLRIDPADLERYPGPPRGCEFLVGDFSTQLIAVVLYPDPSEEGPAKVYMSEYEVSR